MGGIDRALGSLSSGVVKVVVAAAVIAALLVGAGAAVIRPLWVAAAIGFATFFAALAAAPAGLLGSILLGAIDAESRRWGVVVVTVALVWLAHPALLLLTPGALALPLALISAVASLGVARFASGAVEAAARP